MGKKQSETPYSIDGCLRFQEIWHAQRYNFPAGKTFIQFANESQSMRFTYTVREKQQRDKGVLKYIGVSLKYMYLYC